MPNWLKGNKYIVITIQIKYYESINYYKLVNVELN